MTTSALSVHAVTSAEDLLKALRLPHQLYGALPHWVGPPMLFWRKRIGAAIKAGQVQLLVAKRGAEVVGTVSLQASTSDAGLGWFGMLQVPDDPSVLQVLWPALTHLAAAQGIRRLRGPRDLSRFEYVGLTVEGFDRMPPLLQGHHGPWIAPQLQALGLAPHHDVLAYEVPLYEPDGTPRQVPEKLRRQSAALDVPGVEVRRARWRSIDADLRAAHTVLNASYASVPDVQPMPLSTWMTLGRTFLSVANKELIQLAFVEGQPAAFAVVLPEVHEALLANRGRFGAIRTLFAARQIHSVGFKLFGVDPRYRGTGLHARLIEHVVDGARRAGYDRIDGSVIDVRNKPMRAVVEGAGMQVYRRYRFYDGAV